MITGYGNSYSKTEQDWLAAILIDCVAEMEENCQTQVIAAEREAVTCPIIHGIIVSVEPKISLHSE